MGIDSMSGRQLGFCHQADVFLPQLDLALINAVRFIAQMRCIREKRTSLASRAQIAVKAIVPARSGLPGKAEAPHPWRGRLRADCEWAEERIGIGQLKGESIGKNSRGMQQCRAPIADGLLVQLGMQQPPWLMPQAGRQECDRVFKIAALRLKMVRAQIHPLRPHHPRQKFHSDRTIFGEAC